MTMTPTSVLGYPALFEENVHYSVPGVLDAINAICYNWTLPQQATQS